MVSMDPYMWIAAGITIAVLSIYFRETIFSRFVEYTLVGGYAGHYAVSALFALAKFAGEIPKGRITYLIPFILSITFFSRWILPEKYRWVDRYGSATLIAIGIGLSLRASVDTQIAKQLVSTFQPFTTPDPLTNFNVLLTIFIVFTTLSYFVYTAGYLGKFGEKGLAFTSKTGKLGRYFIFISLGAAFANVWTSRVSLLLGRIYFLLHDWLAITVV